MGKSVVGMLCVLGVTAALCGPAGAGVTGHYVNGVEGQCTCFTLTKIF